jgi:hypothetical protein
MEESGNFVWPQDWGDCKRCSTLPQLIKPVGVLKECSEEIVARTKDKILPILKAKCPPQNPHPHIETLYVTITGCPIVFWTAVFSCEPYPQAKYPVEAHPKSFLLRVFRRLTSFFTRRTRTQQQ